MPAWDKEYLCMENKNPYQKLTLEVLRSMPAFLTGEALNLGRSLHLATAGKDLSTL